MLKRLAILVLTVLVFASIGAQTMAHAMAMGPATPATVPCDMMDMDDAAAPAPAQDMPCKGMIPVCADSLGCAVVVDLPAPPSAEFVAVNWVQVVWAAAGTTLAGRTVPPELFPPILSA